MRIARTLATAALAFTTACASAPKARPEPVAAAPAPAPQATAPAKPEAPASTDDDAKALFAEALTAFDAGNWEAAEKGFRKVLEKVPHSVNAQYNLGVVAERQGQLKQAEAAYLAARKLSPGHTPTLLNLGKVYRQEEKFDEAIALYEEALKAPGREHDVALLNNLTVAYRLAGKFDRAEATARLVLARSKDNAEAYKNLSLIYYDQGQYRLAEFISANARKLDDKDPGVYNNLGMIYLKMNERPEALAQFQKAVSLDEKFAPGYLNIGAMALAYRDYEGAEKAFARAVALDPTSYESYLYFGYALDGQRTRDPKKGLAAGEAFEKVLAMREGQPEAVCGAGWAYSVDRAGWDKALRYLEQCRSLPATRPEDREAIEAKLNGIRTMQKAPPPAPPAPAKEAADKAAADKAAADAKAPAPGQDGSSGSAMVDQVTAQEAQQEGVDPNAPRPEAAPAAADPASAPAEGAAAPQEAGAPPAPPAAQAPAPAAPQAAPAATPAP